MTEKLMISIAAMALTIMAAQTPPPPAAPAQPAPPAPPKKTSTVANRVVVRGSGGSFLGVGVAEVEAERAKALNLREERGAEVKSVEEDSPAEKAGVKVGDVVVEYNGQRVEGIEQFVRMVRETPPGRKATLTVWRNGAQQTLTATIATRKAMTRSWNTDGGVEVHIPEIRIPEIRIPDLPRTIMSWRSSTLGIEAESLSSQLAEFFGVKDGVLVRSVVKDSPASKAGIKAGDVITKVDDSKVTSPREVTSALRGARSKKTIPVVLVRNQKETTVQVTLEEKSEAQQDRERALFQGRGFEFSRRFKALIPEERDTI